MFDEHQDQLAKEELKREDLEDNASVVFDVVDEAQIPLHQREEIFHDSKEIHNPSGADGDSNPFERLTSLQDLIHIDEITSDFDCDSGHPTNSCKCRVQKLRPKIMGKL